MSASEISSELSPMAQCGEDQSEALSSDIGGFLSASCMETDVEKSDPFNSDSTLGFADVSSRFDTECILSSSLVEGVSRQQTTVCDSSVPSFVSGLDGVGSCSVLGGGSFLLYDIPSSSVQKPANPVVQMLPSNVFEFLTDVKGEQKLDVLSPVQLLAPSVSVTQSHPVIIGNPSAASFVKSVLKDATALPSTSSGAPNATRDAASVPPVMFLNPAFLPLLQSVSGISPSPMLIQLPSGFGITGTQEVQQLVSGVMSQPGSTLVTAPVADANASVGVDSLSAQCDTVMTSGDTSHDPNTSTVSYSTLSSVSAPLQSTDSLCVHNPTSGHTPPGEESTSVVNSNNSSVTTDGVVSSLCEPSSSSSSSSSHSLCEPSSSLSSHSLCEPSSSSLSHSLCEASAPPVSEPQAPRAPRHPIVISCLRPEDKGGKGMKQILEHFLHQNKANASQAAVSAPSSQPVSLSLSTNLVDCTSASASECGDMKPQVVSASDLGTSCSSPLFTVPSLGRKSSSVVFILRRTDSQAASAHCTLNKTSSGQTSVPDKASTTTMISSLPATKEDEVDGSMTEAASTAGLIADGADSSESGQVPKATMAELSSDPTVITSNAEIGDADSSAQYQWVQIQVPANLASEGTATAAGCEEGGEDDIQKLIPLTVNEKFSSDVCRPIIICIVQEDGLMKRVNINPVDRPSGQEGEGVEEGSATQHTSSPSESIEARPLAAEPLDSPGSSSQPGSNPASHTPSSTPITPSPSHTSAESSLSSSPQTGSEGGSPPIRLQAGLKPCKDKQYKCDLCTAVFSRLSNYTRHRKIHTLNLKEDNHFKCPHCERPFLQRCDMNRHIAVHTNEYPFRCQTCNKGYIRKSDLVVHERFHSKTRAFKCETCGRSFYQSGDLNRHKRFVHMEQSQLSCGHCHRKYASEVTLIRHIKTAHNDILLQSAAQHTQQQ